MFVFYLPSGWLEPDVPVCGRWFPPDWLCEPRCCPVLPIGAGSCRGRSVSGWSARSVARTYDLDGDLCAATGCPARGGRSRPGHAGAVNRGRYGGGRLAAGAGMPTGGSGPGRCASALEARGRAAAPRDELPPCTFRPIRAGNFAVCSSPLVDLCPRFGVVRDRTAWRAVACP